MAEEKQGLIEARSIDVVPDNERHGTPFSQFTLWFGANVQITAAVTGSLAVVFGADPLWGLIGLLIGNLLGGAVMALHSAQGPRLGLPQMISSRAQFGVYGATLPIVFAVLMYLGFASTGAILAGQAVDVILGVETPAVGIVVFGVMTALMAILGYKYIHGLGRLATITGMIGFAYLTVMAFVKFPVLSFLGVKPFEWSTFLLAVSLSAAWQLAYAPYVADYSRYLPRSTTKKTAFWNTFLGVVLGTQWAMTLGVILSAASSAGYGGDFVRSQAHYFGELGGGGLIALAIYLIVIIGKLTVNTLNAYGCFMSFLTITTAFSGARMISQLQRTLMIVGLIFISVLIAIFASSDFLNLFKNFVLMLTMVFIPWTVINLIDFYRISRENFDIPALYTPKGRYGKWNPVALVTYAVGIAVQIPFISRTMYTGPIVKWMDGADISWLVGLVVCAAIYYPWAKRRNAAPAAMIYPQSFLAAGKK